MTLVAGCYERFLFGFSCDAGGEQTERAPLRRTFTHAAHKGVVKALAAAGPFVASGGADDLIHLYDLKADKDLGFLMNPGEGAVTALSFFTPPGRYAPSHLLAGCSDGSVSVWRAGGGWECLKSLRGHRREVTALAVHPSGRLALSTSRDGCLRMWDMVKGRSTFTARLDGEGEGVAFAPGGATYAVTCGAVVTVHAAGGGGGGVLASLRHPRRVLCAAFGPTGRCVVTGSEDGSLRVWDAAAGEEVLCISRAHATRIKALTLPHAPPEAAPAAAQGAGGGGGGGELEELAAAVPALVATASSDGVVKMWALRDAVLAQLQRGGLGGGGAAADDGGAAACVGQAATRARLTVLCSVDPLDEMERRFQEQAETKQREHDQRKKSKKAAVAAAAAAEAPGRGAVVAKGRKETRSVAAKPQVETAQVAKGKVGGAKRKQVGAAAAAAAAAPAAKPKAQPKGKAAPAAAAEPAPRDTGISAGGVVNFMDETDAERQRKKRRQVALNAKRLGEQRSAKRKRAKPAPGGAAGPSE